MAFNGKFLSKIEVSNYFNSKKLDIGVYGIFDSKTIKWEYFVISYQPTASGINLIPVIGSIQFTINEALYSDIIKCGLKVNSIQEGEEFCNNFKMKWETGSNNTTSESRDKKLNEILK